ncbi:N-acyl homoserine lactonase family protein [Agromyces sp. NPDC049794]|uniref:N-acyl homoserine lactonase family protein n=1 Tax=unclassified Agromyces TaxID=2639701 RepID=UPI0033CC397A
MQSNRYEITVVRYATTTLLRSRLFLNDFLNEVADESRGLDYYFWIVRNDERTILIDTGFAAEVGARRGREVLIDPLDAMQALGVDLDAELDIVVTHMHYDHIGNVDAFPRSHITLARSEFDFWTGPIAGRSQFAHLRETTEVHAIARAHDDGRVSLIDGDTDLYPGIRLLLVGGHTPGQLMVLVESESGPILVTSDAVHYEEELSLGRPFIYMDHLSASYAAYDRISEITAETSGARILLGHDPAALAQIPHAAHPLLPDHASVIGGNVLDDIEGREARMIDGGRHDNGEEKHE